MDLCSWVRCENMEDDHDNDEEIDEQVVSDDDYDNGTDGCEYSSGESDSQEDMLKGNYREFLRDSTRQNFDKQTSFCVPDLIRY